MTTYAGSGAPADPPAKRWPRAALGAAAAVLASTTPAIGCTDDRCNIENMKTLLNTCRLQVAYEKRECAVLFGLSPDASVDLIYQNDVRTCQRQGQGACVACLASAGRDCEQTAVPDAGMTRGQAVARCCQAADERCCPAANPTPDQACVNGCYAQFEACPCPTDAGVQACFDCSSRCDDAYRKCSAACPRS